MSTANSNPSLDASKPEAGFISDLAQAKIADLIDRYSSELLRLCSECDAKNAADYPRAAALCFRLLCESACVAEQFTKTTGEKKKKFVLDVCNHIVDKLLEEHKDKLSNSLLAPHLKKLLSESTLESIIASSRKLNVVANLIEDAQACCCLAPPDVNDDDAARCGLLNKLMAFIRRR